MTVQRPVMTPFWLALWACTLSLGWLLPNHYLPWLSFHADAWVAIWMSMAAVAIVIRTSAPVAWHGIGVLVLLMLFMPWVQYGAGQVQFAGTAWITSLYLLGFLMALLVGVQWEAHSPGQLLNGLFLAIGLAALLSVGLQLQQWLSIDGLELWTMGGGPDRPHANLGQPNQLGTLLVWGALAAAWSWLRGHIGGRTAILMALFLLFGLALTRSRTAWIAMVILVVASWLWSGLWKEAKLPWIVTGLGLYFAGCVLGLGWFNPIASTGQLPDLAEYTRMSGEVRPLVWAALLDAAWRQPLWGYGWGQVVQAQMAVAADHPYLQGVYIYSHNLFLDLVLWCGIPVGLMVAVVLLGWFWRRLRAIRTAENAVLLLFLLVIANHALLELPLYHAYFLLPVGMVMGTLHSRLGVRPVMQTGRTAMAVLCLASISALALVVRDYARSEQSYQNLRMEWSGIKLKTPATAPDVLLLTQWHEYLSYARFEPRAGLSSEQLDWMRHVASMFPNVVFLNKLAMALAMNGQPEEASLWIQRMCKLVPESTCNLASRTWIRQGKTSPEIAAIAWPLDVPK